MKGVGIAASIVAGYTVAVILVAYGTSCGCPWRMNLCWVVAAACMYAAIARAMRADRSSS